MNKKSYLDFTKRLPKKKILVWGLGLSGGGVGVTQFFAKYDAKVRVTDLRSEEELQKSIKQLQNYGDIEYVLGEHRKKDFLWADLIIRNPAIPPHAPLLTFAKKSGKKVEMELSLFLKYCPAFTIGVTGTRGKSTTTTLITEILNQAGKKVITGGNNEITLLNQLDDLDEETIVTIEMSSFQLSECSGDRLSPNVAVVTNLYHDHLNWHPDMEHYIKSKTNILRFQKSGDLGVFNIDNSLVKENFSRLGKSRKATFGEAEDADIGIRNGKILDHGKLLIRANDLKLKGDHNLYNFAAASAATLSFGVEPNMIRGVGRTFGGLPHRQEIVGTFEGITYVDDSYSTIPEAIIACLKRFGKQEGQRIHLILGGRNKNLDLRQILAYLDRYVETAHFFASSFYDEISPHLSTLRRTKVFGPFESSQKIIDNAQSKALEGDYIILSPGAASPVWEWGEQFHRIVKK